MLTTVVVNERLDLRGERAGDLPAVQVARAVAHAQRDDHAAMRASRSRHRSRVGPEKSL